MKPKTFSRKLALNKLTVSNLTDIQMQRAKGGLPNTSIGHVALCYTACNTGVCCAPVTEPSEPDGTLIC